MIESHWSLVTAPTNEPITLDEAKQQCRVDVNDENALLINYIVAARHAAENYLSRGLFTQTWKYTQSHWSDEMWLPMAGPLSSVSSVQYYASDGVLTTLATSVYETDTDSEPGRVVRKPDQTFPVLQSDKRGPRVSVTYVVGQSNTTNIPQAIKEGIAVMVRALYERQTGKDWSVSESAAHALWSPYRVWWRQPSCDTYAAVAG